MDNTIYKNRRNNLEKSLPENSVLLIPGADMQYRNADSAYAFRQDSSFYYFSGFSEPLLTKHLEELISTLRKKHKNSVIEINTNTDLLNQKRIKSLFKSGLSSIRCSIYDDEIRLKEVGKLLEDCGIDESAYSLRPRYFDKSNLGFSSLIIEEV